MADTLVKDLIDAGIHFGQLKSGWNPKMGPYIYGVRNKIHIIDIRETIKGLLIAKRFLQEVVASGKNVCIVGTKRQAKVAVEEVATELGMPWVTERWLGGTLTNFKTIRSRLKRLEELEALVESGEIASYSKKMESQLMREKRKITRNLQGIRNMRKLPGAMIIVDTTRESNALREARAMKIPTVCLLDTDGDPDVTDIPIPGNDDSMRSIELILRELGKAITAGKEGRRSADSEAKKSGNDGEQEQGSSRRSSRPNRGELSASAVAQQTVEGEAVTATATATEMPPATDTPPATDETPPST